MKKNIKKTCPYAFFTEKEKNVVEGKLISAYFQRDHKGCCLKQYEKDNEVALIVSSLLRTLPLDCKECIAVFETWK